MFTSSASAFLPRLRLRRLFPEISRKIFTETKEAYAGRFHKNRTEPVWQNIKKETIRMNSRCLFGKGNQYFHLDIASN